MRLTLQRFAPSPELMPGELFVDGEHECWTLERSPHDPKFVPIKAGVYPVTIYNSPRFNRRVLLLHGVPQREYIEIHHGNFVDDTEGCILVGRIRTKVTVIGSILALDALIGKVEVALIEDRVPETWIEVIDPAEALAA